MAQIQDLFIYPIKSLRGISLKSTLVDQWGLQFDRQWMLVDEGGKFISQRQVPELAQFSVDIQGDQLTITKSEDSVSLNLFGGIGESMEVTIWDSTLEAQLESQQISDWFSQKLGKTVFLVRYGSMSKRIKKKEYGDIDIKFPDGYPLLITNRESLKSLNGFLNTNIPMDRFRPNIVLSGIPAWDETKLAKFDLKKGSIHFAKECERCVVTSVDQKTGIKTDPNIAKALVDLNGSPAVFGANCYTRSGFVLKVGDQVVF
jgi:uncharacterized protein